MKFIVCVKQVPDVTSPLQLHDGDLNVGAGRSVMNAYDASAVEEALVLTEQHGGSVDVVLLGPEEGGETLRKALSMGAASAVHLRLEEAVHLDSRASAEVLAEHLREQSFDVLACGKQAQDTDAGLTGSMLGELLGMPFVGNAVGMDLDGDRLVVRRQADAGREIIVMDTPCVVSCSNDMNDPRIPNLKGIMAAKRKPIEVKSVSLPSDVSGSRLRRHEAIPERPAGRILDGDLDDVVSELVNLLEGEESVL